MFTNQLSCPHEPWKHGTSWWWFACYLIISSDMEGILHRCPTRLSAASSSVLPLYLSLTLLMRLYPHVDFFIHLLCGWRATRRLFSSLSDMLLLENQHVWKTSRPGWQLSSWNCVVAILICCVTLEIVPHQDLWLSLDNSQITPSDSGSNLDKQLCFSIYISNLKWSCRFFHYNIRRIHPFLSTSAFSVSCHFEMGLLQLAPGRSDCTKDLSLAKYPEDSCCLNQI